MERKRGCRPYAGPWTVVLTGGKRKRRRRREKTKAEKDEGSGLKNIGVRERETGERIEREYRTMRMDV